MSEFAYTDRDFDRIRALIRQRAGIALADGKRDMAYSRLARLLRKAHLRSVNDYLDQLERQGTADDWQDFINALTTNLTSFFRESHHFDMLRELLRRKGAPPQQRIWCAGASTGEEAWTLAITACEAFDSLQPPVEIIATDIDTACLQTARRAVYPVTRIEGLSDARKRRFFQRGTGNNMGHARVIPALQKLVSFAPSNLLDPQWPVQGPLDAIFCRNVMIYFDKTTQRRLLERMAPMLRPEGLFFAGHSESFFHAADVVRACGRTVYAPVRSRHVGFAA
ncbi:MAG: CheR family methyltransferase [Algiphilus sp.]